MPRVKTPQGVQEFAYTRGGKAAARKLAADQLSIPEDKSGNLAANMAQGAAAGAAAGSTFGPYGAVAGGILGGGLGALGSSPKQVEQVGTTADMLAAAFRKDPEKAAKEVSKKSTKITGVV